MKTKSISWGTAIAGIVLLCIIALTASAEEPARVSSYEELRVAADTGAKEIVVTADITYPEDAEPVVFDHAITIKSADGEHYTIDGNGNRILYIRGTEDGNMVFNTIYDEYEWKTLDETTVITDLTFTNGYAYDTASEDYYRNCGGAINVFGPLDLYRCTFDSNAASGDINRGGALYVHTALTATNCTFLQNTAVAGGAIAARDIILTNCVVTNNEARFGGGIFAQNQVVLTDCEISFNRARSFGGGIDAYEVIVNDGTRIFSNYVEAADVLDGLGDGGGIFGIIVTINNGEIYDNFAYKHGGGISCNTELTIHDGAIYGNTAQQGGGVYCYEFCTNTTITGGVLSGNTADYGGGIYITSGWTVISDVLIAENSAQKGGGIYAGYNVVTITGGKILGNRASIAGESIFSFRAEIILKDGTIRCENDDLYPTGIATDQGKITYGVTRESLVSVDDAP